MNPFAGLLTPTKSAPVVETTPQPENQSPYSGMLLKEYKAPAAPVVPSKISTFVPGIPLAPEKNDLQNAVAGAETKIEKYVPETGFTAGAYQSLKGTLNNVVDSLSQVHQSFATNESSTKQITSLLKLAGSALMVPIAPINAALQGGENIDLKGADYLNPVLVTAKYGSKLVNSVFGAIFGGVGAVADFAASNPNLSQDQKDLIKEGVNLAGMLAVGAVIHKVGGEVVDFKKTTLDSNSIVRTAANVLDIPTQNNALGQIKPVATDVLNQKYRDLAKVAHPDVGGTEQGMAILNKAKAVLEDHATMKPADFIKKYQGELDGAQSVINPPAQLGSGEAPTQASVPAKVLQDYATLKHNTVELPSDQQSVYANQLNYLRATLDKSFEDNKKTAISIPATDKTSAPALSVNVAPISDGKFAFSYDINTPENGLSADFTSNPIANSLAEAVDLAKKEVLKYAQENIKNVSDPSSFQHIIDNINTGFNSSIANEQQYAAGAGERVKAMQIPDQPNSVEIQTPSGKITVTTDQPNVLLQFAKNENITFKNVDSIGKNPDGTDIQSRFSWDQANKTGTIEVTDAQTAVQLAREFGMNVPLETRTKLNEQLANILPNYAKDRAAINQMLADYSLAKLGGNATAQEILNKMIEVAANMHAEIAKVSAGELRKTQNEPFVRQITDITKNPDVSANAPELTNLVDFAEGKDVFNLQAITGTTAKSAAFMELQKAKKEMLKEGINSEAVYRETLQADARKQELIDRENSHDLSAFMDWKNVLKAIKNSADFRKEGRIGDTTAAGTIMQRGDRYVLVPRSEVGRQAGKGFVVVGTMDEVINASGFETVDDYVDFITQLDKDQRTVVSTEPRKVAHEYLLKNDPNYANIDATLARLRNELVQEAEAISSPQPTADRNSRQVPNEQTKVVEVAARPDVLTQEVQSYGSFGQLEKSGTVLYHGTSGEINGFLNPVGGASRGKGLYLTPDAKQAERYGTPHKVIVVPSAKIAEFSRVGVDKAFTDEMISGLTKMGLNPVLSDGWIRTDKGNLDLSSISAHKLNSFLKNIGDKGGELTTAMGYDGAKFPQETQVVMYSNDKVVTEKQAKEIFSSTANKGKVGVAPVFDSKTTSVEKGGLEKLGFGQDATGFGSEATVYSIDGKPAVAMHYDGGLDGFSVAKDVRGQGIGEAFLRQMAEENSSKTLKVIAPNEGMMKLMKRVGDVNDNGSGEVLLKVGNPPANTPNPSEIPSTAPVTTVDLAKKQKEFNQKETTDLREQTMSGQREAKRLADAQSIANVRDLLPPDAQPTDTVPVYRAGKGDIKPGDQVTLIKDNAERYVNLRRDSTVHEIPVKIEDLVKANGLRSEFVYAPKESLAVKPAEAAPVRTTIAQEPKKPFEARKGVSAVFERLKNEQQDSITYDVQNLKENAEKAVDLIANDPQKAFRIAMGAEDAPAGQTETAVNIALAEKALADGNDKMFGELTARRSIEQTRRGQELVAERGSVSDNSTSRYVKELLRDRIRKALDERAYKISDFTERKTPKIDRVFNEEVKKVKQKMKTAKEMDLDQAQSFLDSLACK